jgi:hypothetical protein
MLVLTSLSKKDLMFKNNLKRGRVFHLILYVQLLDNEYNTSDLQLTLIHLMHIHSISYCSYFIMFLFLAIYKSL